MARRFPRVPVGLSIAALSTCALALSACTRIGEPPPHTQMLIVATRNDPYGLNPLFLNGGTAERIGALGYSYLTYYDPRGNMIGDVALQVPSTSNGGVSRDGSRVTYHLRPGARWQDGAELTSRDVAFTFGAIMSPANAVTTRTGYDRVASVETPDAGTVIVRLKEPYSPIVAEFFGGDSIYPILPAHLLARLRDLNHAAFNSSPVGSGPFVFTRWLHGDRIDADANRTYFLGRPGLDRIRLRTIQSSSTLTTQLMTHEIDATFGADVTDLAVLRAIPDHRVVVTHVPGLFYVGFNLGDPVAGDAAVRRAYALAIDRHALVDKVTNGVYLPDTGLRGLFTWAYDPRAGNVPYDPRRARAVLSHDGWLPGPDGTRVKNGQRLELQLAYASGRRTEEAFALLIAAQERAVGIDVSIKAYAYEKIFANDGPLAEGRYQVALASLIANYDAAAGWVIACSQVAPKGFNQARYCNPAVDRALDEASSSFDRATQLREYSFVQRQLLADLPIYALCQTAEIDVIPTGLKGFEPSVIGDPYISVVRWHFR